MGEKIVEFINLCQGGMSIEEYSLKLTQFSKYAPIIVPNPRARMNKFVMGCLLGGERVSYDNDS